MMKPSMLRKCVVVSTLLFVLLDVVAVNALSKPRQTSILTIRGGNLDPAGSLYESNPNYERPMTLGDLESGDYSQNNIFNGQQQQQQQHMQMQMQQQQPVRRSYLSANAQGPTSFDSVTSSIQGYFLHLYASSPAVAQTLVTCLGTFLLWQISAAQPILQDYFVCSRRNFVAGRWSALLLSSISHAGLFHLAFNLMTLVSIGIPVQQTLQLSKWPLWPLLLGGALAGSFSYLLFESGGGGCIGLSAVTLSLLAVQAQLYPKNVMAFRLMGVIPVRIQAEKALRVLLVWSLWGSLWKRGKGGGGGGVPIAHSAHLGGLLFGIAYHAAWVRQRDVGRLLHRAERIFKQRQRFLRKALLPLYKYATSKA
jgi:membrane associated rhomboid family serine protease